MNRICALLASVSLTALVMTPAVAQEVPAAPPPPAPAAATTAPVEQEVAAADVADEGNLDEIIVTGTRARGRTVLQSSVAVTTVNEAELLRKSPRSLASALELIPGIYVEDSGGEISNNFSVRGLAGGAQSFIQIQEDGLPVFYTNALTDTILKPELSIDRFEAVRGGTSGILTVNGAGATINFITRKPRDEFEATIRLTGSDFDTKRVDVWAGGPLGDDWFASVGGFYRSSDGVRDPGFTGDRGGLVRAALTKKFDDGFFTVNVKVVDEHNTFLLPIPLQGVNNPRAIPGFSATSGTLLSLDNGVQTVRTSQQTGRLSQVNDLTDGVATRSYSVGYDFEKEVADDIILRSKGRYTDFKNDFNAVFNFDNSTLLPAVSRLDPTRSDIAFLQQRFAPQGAVRAGYRYVDTGEVIAGPAAQNALNGNGLVAESITAKNLRYVEEFANDISLTWQTERNALTGGFLYFSTRVRGGNVGASTFITEIRDNPRRLDIVALDANDNVVGSLTENGLLNYATWGEGNSVSEQDSYSFYANDEFKVTDRLRVDAGIRVERLEFNGRESITLDLVRNPAGITSDPRAIIPGAFDANGNDVDNIIANNFYGQFGGGPFSGNFRTVSGKRTELSWTVGGNYQLLDNLAFYGRYADSYQANAQNPVTSIRFAEVGGRFQKGGFSAQLTGFRTLFDDFVISRQFPNETLPREFTSNIKVWGLEFDAIWRPVEFFQIQMTGVVQDTGFSVGQARQNLTDAQVDEFRALFDGNQPERTPELNFTLTPTFFLPDDRGEVSFSWQHISERFSDQANSLALPAYDVLSASASFNVTERFELAVSVDNITNEIGLTEGNPRSGFTENPGVSDFFYARPILGRNWVFSGTYRF